MIALRFESVSKHLGAIYAPNDITMSLAPGVVVGLMGDNGAGKSTLAKVIAGNDRTTSDRIFIKECDRPQQAGQNGIEIDCPAMNEVATRPLRDLRSQARTKDMVRMMSGGQRQAVAIARTRPNDPAIVPMDQPSTAISLRKVAEVINLIRERSSHALAVVLISHGIPDVLAAADRIVVSRRGTKVADKPTSQTSPEEIVGRITGAIERS